MLNTKATNLCIGSFILKPSQDACMSLRLKTMKKKPRLQTGFDFASGVPIWGENIYSLNPGDAAVIDAEVFGFPIKSIKDIPPGEYYVQGFLTIYTEFKRADGHTLWMHTDQWEGQKWNVSPGNLYSDVQKIEIKPSGEKIIKLKCKQATWIHFFKIMPWFYWKNFSTKQKIHITMVSWSMVTANLTAGVPGELKY